MLLDGRDVEGALAERVHEPCDALRVAVQSRDSARRKDSVVLTAGGGGLLPQVFVQLCLRERLELCSEADALPQRVEHGRRKVRVNAAMAQQHEVRAGIADGVGRRQLVERVQDLGSHVLGALDDDDEARIGGAHLALKLPPKLQALDARRPQGADAKLDEKQLEQLAEFVAMPPTQASARRVLIARKAVEVSVVLPTPAGPCSTIPELELASASLKWAISRSCFAARKTAASAAMPSLNKPRSRPKCAWYIATRALRRRFGRPRVCPAGPGGS